MIDKILNKVFRQYLKMKPVKAKIQQRQYMCKRYSGRETLQKSRRMDNNKILAQKTGRLLQLSMKQVSEKRNIKQKIYSTQWYYASGKESKYVAMKKE